jgi:peptidoglycan/LPS O-acetylase OafA/YrhL
MNKDIDRIYFPELDGLRFFAFLLVFVHHTSLFSHFPVLSILNTNGWIGVDIFFALSAFLFTKLLTTEYEKTGSISFRKFYMRRIFRIWPIYYLFVGFSIAVYFFLHDGIISSEIWARMVGLLTFTDNIMAVSSGYSPIQSTQHLWTIGYEEQFYIFIPIIIYLMVRATSKIKLFSVFMVFILFNGIRVIFISRDAPHPAIWVLPITHFEAIVMGIIIGFGGMDFIVKWIKPWIIGIIGIFFFTLLIILPEPSDNSYWLILTYSSIGISTSLILLSVLNSITLKKVLSHEILVFLGKRSYGLYVYHVFSVSLVRSILPPVSNVLLKDLVLFMCSLALTILVSIISYTIIEKPFLQLKKKFEVIVSRPI